MSNNKWEESVKLSPPYGRKPTPGLHEKIEAAIKKANLDFDNAAKMPNKARCWDEIRNVLNEFDRYKNVDDSDILAALVPFLRETLTKLESE